MQKDVLITDSSAQLTFSNDTILFDTVFTTVGTVTKNFKIINPHNQPINISSIDLASGTSSDYRINVDGIPGFPLPTLKFPQTTVYLCLLRPQLIRRE